MCGSMVDVQSATAAIRRGGEKRRKNKLQDENVVSASATQGGHNKFELCEVVSCFHLNNCNVVV